MTDIYDAASDLEMAERERAIAAQSARAKSGRPSPMGYCLNPACCELFETHESDRLFCGRECADEHARRSR